MNGERHRLPEQKVVTRSSFTNTWPVVAPHPMRPLQDWDGEITVTGTREVEGPVRISAGTTVYLGEGALLRFHDRLLVEGTRERPVRFLPAPGNRKPWGAVVLTGPGASGSRLQHCVFTGGSGVKADLFEYSGMFSIHHVEGVRVSDCSFSDNREVDDTVHAVYSEVHFENVLFQRARSDALDLDISNAVIENSRFLESGNDAVDLMTTGAVILGSALIGSGDKGVSVGEGSRLLSIDNLIQGNGIGVQSKDGSTAVLINTTLRDNAVSLNAYRKNWRYGKGGRIFVYKSRIEGEADGISADKRSRITISDSYLSRLPALTRKQRKRIRIAPNVDAVSPQRAADPGLERFPEERKALGDLGGAYLDRIDSGRRGAGDHDR